MAKKSIVIIGGGPAGLTAAYELLKDNGSEQYDVTVLEASGEFGLRIWSVGGRISNIIPYDVVFFALYAGDLVKDLETE